MKVPILRTPKQISSYKPKHAISIMATSFVLCFLIYLLINWFVERYPFGEVPVALGDEAWQFLPFYADLWEVLHGNPRTSLLFSWNAGMGVPRIGDYTTYLGGPFPLLIALFPKKYLAMGYFIVKGIKLSCAAAAFSALLHRISPNQKNANYQIFSMIYAFGGWTLEIGAVRIIWLDGLISLPLITIAGLLSYKRKARSTAIALICFCWWSNYYTAYMASLGAALLIIVLCFTSNSKTIDRVKGILNFALNGVLAIAICAILLWPTFLSVKEGINIPGGSFKSPSFFKLAKSLYGGSITYPALPSIFVGYLLLFYLVAFFINKQISVKLKFCATVILACSIGSFFFKPATLVWNLFDAPNGTWFRFSFVIIGYLTLLGFYSFTQIKHLNIYNRILCCLAVLLPAIWAYLNNKIIFSADSKLAFISFLAFFSAVLAFILFELKNISHFCRTIATGSALASIVIMVLMNSGLATTYFVGNLAGLNSPAIGIKHSQQASISPFVFSHAPIPYNNGFLYGVPEASYYSSIAPRELGINLASWYGANTSSGGRMVSFTEDPYLISISGGNNIFDTSTGEIRRLDVSGVPFVSTQPRKPEYSDSLKHLDNTFSNREKAVLGSIYSESLPAISANGKPANFDEKDSSVKYKSGDSLSINCSGTDVPQVLVDDNALRVSIEGKSPETFNNGTVISALDNTLSFRVFDISSGKKSGTLAFKDVRCLSLHNLNKAVKLFNNVSVDVKGRSFSFYAEKGNTYRVRVPYSEKWKCSQARTDSINQFLGVYAHHTGKVTCSYQIPGLATGTLVSFVSCILAFALCMKESGVEFSRVFKAFRFCS